MLKWISTNDMAEIKRQILYTILKAEAYGPYYISSPVQNE
jgi:hypothetical protein